MSITTAQAQPAPTPGGTEATLPEVAVTGRRFDPYAPRPSSTALKLDAPPLDVPATVNEVPRQVLQDRAVVRPDEAIDNVAGVRLIPGYPGAPGFLIRGFFENYNTLLNGLRIDNSVLPDVSTIERFDVLKGPASILYGNSSAGGLINIVTRRPEETPHYSITATGGSYDFARTTLDATGRLTQDGSVLYRLDGAFDHGGNFRGRKQGEDMSISPTFTFRLTPDDILTTRFEYQHQAYFYDGDIPTVARPLTQIPVTRSLSDPGLGSSRNDVYRASYDYQHRFNDDWRVRQAFQVSETAYNIGSDRIDTGQLAPDGRTYLREFEQGPQRQADYVLQNEVYGRLATGPVGHQLLLGAEAYRQTFNYLDNTTALFPLNIFNPNYGVRPGPLSFGYGGSYGDQDVGIYWQDLMTLTPKVKLLFGARYDFNDSFSQTLLSPGVVTGLRSNVQSRGFSPRVGVVYQPLPDTSLYAAWTNSFIPNVGASRTGTAFVPTQGEQYEVGVKQAWMGGRLTTTLALFHVTRSNVLTADLANPTFSVQTGEQRSQGVELEAAGEILPGWSVLASYAFTDAAVTKDNAIPVGDALPGVPRNAASVWTKYEVRDGPLSGLGIGAGAYYVSSRQAALPSTFKLANYTRLDAEVSYRFLDRYTARVNAKNLTNSASPCSRRRSGQGHFPGQPGPAQDAAAAGAGAPWPWRGEARDPPGRATAGCAGRTRPRAARSSRPAAPPRPRPSILPPSSRAPEPRTRTAHDRVPADSPQIRSILLTVPTS